MSVFIRPHNVSIIIHFNCSVISSVLQVKQLRNRADEDARLVHMSLQMDSELPSSLRKDLDHLMVLVRLRSEHISAHQS